VHLAKTVAIYAFFCGGEIVFAKTPEQKIPPCRRRVKKVKSIFTLFLPCFCFFVRQRNKKGLVFPKISPLCSQKNSPKFFQKLPTFETQTPYV
jgi:hypothetical protein